ncbi:MAG: hypothetical protein ACRCT8_05020, partial [Lacipirellulaceae bacterium]
ASYLEGERAMMLDVVQRVYSPRGVLTQEGLRELASWKDEDWLFQLGSPADRDPASWALSPAISLANATAGETRDAIQHFFELATADAQAALGSAKSAERFAESLSSRYAVFQLVYPATNSARERFERSGGERDGLLLGIALELHQRQNGDWPATLEELVSRYMPQLPIDRINGGALGYRVVDGQPVVYSRGWDKDDDEGRLPERMRPDPDNESPPEYWTYGGDNDGDWVIWSLGEPRYVGVVEGAE